jgi:hypothetical protein
MLSEEAKPIRIEPVFLFDLDGTLWTASTSSEKAGVSKGQSAQWTTEWTTRAAVTVEFG